MQSEALEPGDLLWHEDGRLVLVHDVIVGKLPVYWPTPGLSESMFNTGRALVHVSGVDDEGRSYLLHQEAVPADVSRRLEDWEPCHCTQHDRVWQDDPPFATASGNHAQERDHRFRRAMRLEPYDEGLAA